ncbi:MAG: HPr(Ser) kinase/phosphatase [Oscillospiraceae bacterium]|nr:HPr(Ser) kinase/phosphatase [Oscillospiraceae bacterium]
MQKKYSVPLSRVVEENSLKIIHKSKNFESINLYSEDVNRPGLQLTGFYNFFDHRRLQIIGMVENSYLNGLTPFKRTQAFETFFCMQIPAVIYARDIEAHKECLIMAEKYDVPVLSTNSTTSEAVSQLVTYIKQNLSPRITRHGVLMEIYGEGVLITGDSGVGKSEAAVEIIKRGHRLIADDAVEITRTAENHLLGSSPELIKHYMEIRGIGVVDVRSLFGTSAVKDDCKIDMVIDLEPWDDTAIYDRLGAEWATTEILNVNIPHLTLPVKPGRNMAAILEVAAMCNRERKMGYNAAATLTEKLFSHVEGQ